MINKELIPVINSNSIDVFSTDNDLEQFLRLRNIILEHIKLNPHVDLPKYLLSFEVQELIKYAYNLSHSMLIKTLWLTGARINEIVKSLKVKDTGIIDDQLIVSLITLKQKNKNKNKTIKRTITITDEKYIQSLKIYIATNKLQNNDYLFNITAKTARNWILKAVTEANKNGVHFPIDITPRTLRHSHAMHLVFNNYEEKEIQAVLGHSNIQNTQVYTNLKAFDVRRKTKFL